MIKQGKVELKGKEYPVLEIKVLSRSENAFERNLAFSWDLLEMTKRRLRIKLNFADAIVVSADTEPDLLSITFRDPYIFKSEATDLAISKFNYLQTGARRQLAQSPSVWEGGLATP